MIVLLKKQSEQARIRAVPSIEIKKKHIRPLQFAHCRLGLELGSEVVVVAIEEKLETRACPRPRSVCANMHDNGHRS
jgi:hypothetical protein